MTDLMLTTTVPRMEEVCKFPPNQVINIKTNHIFYSVEKEQNLMQKNINK